MVAEESIFVKDIKIENLNLSVRATNALKNHKISMLSQILTLGIESLSRISNIGVKTVNEICEFQNRMWEQFGDELKYLEPISEVDEIQQTEKLMLNEAFPELVVDNIKEIWIESPGFYQKNDVFIKDVGFSVRTTNALIAAGYNTIRKVLLEKSDDIRGIRNLGIKSFYEIVDFIVDNIRLISEEGVDSDQSESLYWNFCDYLGIDDGDIEYTDFFAAIRVTIKKLVKISNSEQDSKELFLNEDFIKELYKQDLVIQALENLILPAIRMEHNWISMSMLKEKFSLKIASNDAFCMVIDKLFDAGTIERENDRIRYKLPHISEWLETLKGNTKILVKMRLSGNTLEECGAFLGITRERVRQVVKKTLNKRPVLREDDYSYWYQNYLLDREAMRNISKIGDDIYNEKLSKKDNSTTIVLTIFLIISVFLNIYIYYAFNISTLKYSHSFSSCFKLKFLLPFSRNLR